MGVLLCVAVVLLAIGTAPRGLAREAVRESRDLDSTTSVTTEGSMEEVTLPFTLVPEGNTETATDVSTESQTARSITVSPTASSMPESQTPSSVPPKTSRARWISDALREELWGYSPDTSGSDECLRHGQLYRQHLDNLTLWAVQMLDASAVPGSGLLTGDAYQLGHYDQCISVDVPQHQLIGQYCLPSIQFAPTADYYPSFHDDNPPRVFKQPPPSAVVWDKIKVTSDPRMQRRDVVHIGLCVPASCSHRDIESDLNSRLSKALQKHSLMVNVTLIEDRCFSKLVVLREKGVRFYIMNALIAIVVILTALSTAYELMTERNEVELKSPRRRWLCTFSLVNNMRELLKPDNEEFAFISGMKTLSMMIIMYGHRLYMSMSMPLHNTEENELMYGNFPYTAFNFNGAIVVDTFFTVSGFLMFYKLLRDIDKKRPINIPLYIYYRWIRIVPVYMFIVFFTLYLLPSLGEGPLWRYEYIWRKEACNENIWAMLFFVNNYVSPENECIIPAWYLAADMHMFIVCVLIGYAMWRNHRLGVVLLVLVFLVTLVTPALVTYYYQFPAIVKFYIGYLRYYYKDAQYLNAYVKTHMRAAPYVMGMMTAYIYHRLKKSNFKFSLAGLGAATVYSSVFSLGALLLAHLFYKPGQAEDQLVNILYASLHRISWSSAMCVIIILYATTGFGSLTHILSHPLYAPLNKLMLTVLLTHTPFQMLLSGTIRTPQYVTQMRAFWMASGDIFMSYLLALVVYLYIEAPLSGILNLTLKKIVKPKRKPQQNNPEGTELETKQQTQVENGDIEIRPKYTVCSTD